jgi:hypothetical protein
MAKHKWVCPDCGGTKMAPSRMKAEDSRRFCFGCSEVRGTLIRRTCPVLDRKREAGKAKTAERQKRKSARARARETTNDGLHLPTEWARLFRLAQKHPDIRGARKGMRVPTLEIRVSKGRGGGGRAWKGVWLARVTLGTGKDASDRAYYSELLLHELAHLLAGNGHDEAFWTCVMRLADVAYPGLMKIPAYDRRVATYTRDRILVGYIRESAWYRARGGDDGETGTASGDPEGAAEDPRAG